MKSTPPAQRPRSIGQALRPREHHAAVELVSVVRRCVGAELVQASLFGSRARGEARPDSDVDVLLVFARLPPDREPQATHAEDLAGRVAARTGVPVAVWSVSLVDLERGNRTPMLVDALTDSLPLWCAGNPLRSLPFTRGDALRCTRALLTRLDEGAEEFAGHCRRGDGQAAARRARDDVVRLCTAMLLLDGITRPRRGDAVRTLMLRDGPGVASPGVLAWAAHSFGASGKDEEMPVPQPPGGLREAARTVECLRARTRTRADALGMRASFGRNPGPRTW